MESGIVNLAELQRAVFEVTRQPLTPSEGTRPRLPDGRSTRAIASALIKPNDRLTSFERLQIYNQQYWFRILSSLAEDFPGLRVILGQRRFDKLLVAYLYDCPSESFTMRNLGSRLEAWLRRHREFAPNVERLALDMVRLEWAEIEAFDGAELPRYAEEDLRTLGSDTVFRLQPHLRLLDLVYPVDELLIRIRSAAPASDIASNAVLEFPRKTRTRRFALPQRQRVYLAVYRMDQQVYFKRLTRRAFSLVHSLGQGKPLTAAIEGSTHCTPRSAHRAQEQLREWFENWSSLGWLAKQP